MKSFVTLLLLLFTCQLWSQSSSIRGQLQDDTQSPVIFANIALHNAVDSNMVKVEATDDAGHFHLKNIPAGKYFLVASYVGFDDIRKSDIQLKADEQLNIGILSFKSTSIELSEVTVKASRAMVEVKPDRTVFNVQGTINSTGSDAIELLRKAPAVTVDNNDNINVLGRTGVLLYVDGKRLPLTGEALTDYLKNIPADQIDKIDIITNPGAKYEAEGNAGIIDIRLKRDKSIGANGTANATYSQGRHGRGNVGLSGNYRNKLMNTYASVGVSKSKSYNDIMFRSTQNDIFLDEEIDIIHRDENINYRLGTDFFLNDKHTVGFLVSGRFSDPETESDDRIELSTVAMPSAIDSILIAGNNSVSSRNNTSYNINYRFDDSKKGRSVNVDLDYGKFNQDAKRYQPNRYYDATEQVLLTENISNFDTPTDIDIYTVKVDYEEALWGGTLGAGSKFSNVISDNTFLVFDEIGGQSIQNNNRSNTFKYDEKVYAGYISYNRSINEKISFSAGLRAEQTDATGNLQAFLSELEEPPVELNYLSWFPNVGITYQYKPEHSFALSYGRRINRPDYNVLNPFNSQISELSFEKGNPFLSPEIVNNIELGYTLKYRYNFKLGYSRTTDQITRLIAPDDQDPRASFISWDNLAHQTVYSFNASLPMQLTKKWNAYFNISASHLDNQADYGDGAVVDLQAFTYSIYQQHTFQLPKKFTAEISGYFSGPGIWGGVFEYDTNWSLNLGLQRKFFDDKLNVRLSANDIFFESGWSGVSNFNGLSSEGSGTWDSRRVSLSLSYNFGNQQIKSRKRKTGLESEADRVGNE